MFEGLKVKQTLKSKNILQSFMTRSQHTNKYEGFTSNIVFIAAADTSCTINVCVPRPLLNQNNLAFAIVKTLKRLIKR